jgi:hypothetical protein
VRRVRRGDDDRLDPIILYQPTRIVEHDGGAAQRRDLLRATPVEVIRRGDVRPGDVPVEVLGMTHPHAAGADETDGD